MVSNDSSIVDLIWSFIPRYASAYEYFERYFLTADADRAALGIFCSLVLWAIFVGINKTTMKFFSVQRGEYSDQFSDRLWRRWSQLLQLPRSAPHRNLRPQLLFAQTDSIGKMSRWIHQDAYLRLLEHCPSPLRNHLLHVCKWTEDRPSRFLYQFDGAARSFSSAKNVLAWINIPLKKSLASKNRTECKKSK